MIERTIRLCGKAYCWRGGFQGKLSLVPVWPQSDEEFVIGETVGPMWPSPCSAWWREQYAKDVAANRAAIETRLMNPEETPCLKTFLSRRSLPPRSRRTWTWRARPWRSPGPPDGSSWPTAHWSWSASAPSSWATSRYGISLSGRAGQMPDTRAVVAVQLEAAHKRLVRQREYIEKLGPELRRVMGSQQQTDRLVRIAISAARGNEMMQRATPLSLAGALMTAAVLGLEINTPTGEAYLVPYENRKAPRVDGEFQVEAQLIVGYQGFVKLYRNHPLAGDIFAEAVYPEDSFHYARGTSPYIDHVPNPDGRAPDSEPTHYYAVAILANGAKPFVVLTAEEVKTLRRGKVGPKGDIADPQRWMERKVPLKQLTKLLPKGTRLALAAEVDESSGTELYAQRVQAQRLDEPSALITATTADGRTDVVDTSTGAVIEDPPPGGEGL